jgi:ABC-type polysaccharide/polyol phosphate transport system ATPase subunit
VSILLVDEQLAHFLFRHAFTERCEEMTELGARDGSVLVLVEHTEALDEVLLLRRVPVLADGRVDGQELLER